MQKNLVTSFCALFLVLLNIATSAQNADFIAPLKIPLYLSGNFGELRTNHFHSGLDIKTEGVEGKEVVAVADGYVSRIKISTGGYGKTLYLTHSNGYTTVYAHLQKFNPIIEEFIQNYQYKKQSFTVEVYPGPIQLPIKKGDVIAYSGNTGSSGGPHLHFEIRDSKSQVPLNPLLFGFNISDNIAPTIKKMGVLPMNVNSHVEGKNSRKVYSVSGSNGKYTITQPIKAEGTLGLSIETIDFLNGSSNKCGVFSIEVLVNGTTAYKHNINKVPFHESRYINALIDYEYYKQSGPKLQKAYKEPNTSLGIYNTANQEKTLELIAGETAEVVFKVVDAYNNTSTLTCTLIGEKVDSILQETPTIPNAQFIGWTQESIYQNDSAKVTIPAGTLYNNTNFAVYSLGKFNGNTLYRVQGEATPLQKLVSVQLKTDASFGSTRKNNYYVALVKNNKIYDSYPTQVANGWFSFKTKTLGDFCLAVDSVAPTIKTVNFKNGGTLNSNKIYFTIEDKESGIDTYKGIIDGAWYLFEYDRKKDAFFAELNPQKLQKNTNHSFRIVVSDLVGNESILKGTFTW